MRRPDLLQGALLWGDEWVPLSSATRHFLTAGTTGSGKSLLIKKLLYSSLFGDSRPRSRYLINDPKGEMSAFLASRNVPFTHLHPFLKQSPYWNIGADITNYQTAREVASILIPEPAKSGTSGDNAFWRQAAVDVLSSVMGVLAGTGRWEFRDALLAVLRPDYCSQLLANKGPESPAAASASRVRKIYLEGDQRTFSILQMTMSASLSEYESVAEAWHRAKNRAAPAFSVRSWLSSKDIVLLAQDESAREATIGINRVLFQLASKGLLSQPDVSPSDPQSALSWIIIDEAKEAGNLGSLPILLTNGRAKGAVVVIGFQAIEGLREAYTHNLATEMTGMCQNVAVLRLASPDTAQWASQLFGSRRVTEWTGSESKSDTVNFSNQPSTSSQNTRGQNESFRDKPYFEPSDFLYLPETSPANGLTGFFRFSHLSDRPPDKDRIPWERLEAYSTSAPAAYHRLNEDFSITDWSEAELHRICGAPPSDTTSRSEPKLTPPDDPLEGIGRRD